MSNRQSKQMVKPKAKQMQTVKKPKKMRKSRKARQVFPKILKENIELSNTVKGTGNSNQRRRVQSKTVTMREELGPINGSVAFASTAYNINPGQAISFPWLSIEAKQWEKYRFSKLSYHYTPQVTEFSANGIGSVVMGFDSDASDPPPNDLIHALNVVPRVLNLPCKSQVLNIPQQYLNMMTDGYYVRPGNLPGQSDIKTFDCGIMNLSTVGQTDGGQIGILSVQYTVTFYIPVLDATVGAPKNNSVSSFFSNDLSLTTTVLKTVPFATTNVNGLNITNNGGTFTPPPGNYLVSIASRGTNDAGNNITSYVVNFQKNGTVDPMTLATQNGGSQNSTLSGVYYISCNGTDTFKVSLTATFGAGAVTADTMIQIHTI